LFYWVYLTLKDLFVQIDLKISFSHLFFLYSNKKSIDSLNWQQFIGLGVQVPLSSSQFQSASSSSISTWLTSARTFYIRFEFPLFFLLLFLECRRSFPLIRSDVQSNGHTNTLAYNGGQTGRQRKAVFLSLSFSLYLQRPSTLGTLIMLVTTCRIPPALGRND
jgi:hypothetical protein